MSHNHYFRSPRTYQEARMSLDEPSLVRAKRSLRNLPDGWDDIKNGSYRLRKSWKPKRDTQYRDIKREKFTIIVENEDVGKIHDIMWNIQEHLEHQGFGYNTKWTRGKATIVYYGASIGDWPHSRYVI